MTSTIYSVRRVCKHVPVARSYSLGQHFEVWKDAARDTLLRRSKDTLRNVVPGDGRGAVGAPVEPSRDVPIITQTPKKHI